MEAQRAQQPSHIPTRRLCLRARYAPVRLLWQWYIWTDKRAKFSRALHVRKGLLQRREEITRRATVITKAQALSAKEFHFGTCTPERTETWRRNGTTKTWVRYPSRFAVPVKRGLYQHGTIDQINASQVHTAEDCPLKKD